MRNILIQCFVLKCGAEPSFSPVASPWGLACSRVTTYNFILHCSSWHDWATINELQFKWGCGTKCAYFRLLPSWNSPLVNALSAVLHADLPSHVSWVDVYWRPSNTLLMIAANPYFITGDILQQGSLLQFFRAVVVVFVYKSVLISQPFK